MKWKFLPKNSTSVRLSFEHEVALADVNRFGSSISLFLKGKANLFLSRLDVSVDEFSVLFQSPLTVEETVSVASFIMGFTAGMNYDGGWGWTWFRKDGRSSLGPENHA